METWGLVIDWIGNEFSDRMVRAFQENARTEGHSLVVFTTGSLSYQLDEEALEDQVLPFLNSPILDRLLLYSPQLVRNGGGEKLSRLVNRGRPRPTLSLGSPVGNLPSIVPQHRKAFGALLEHLWTVHHHRRFAWVGGPEDNPDHRERRATFEEFLSLHGVAQPASLDFRGDFSLSTGREAAHQLAQVRNQFDVVVAANDAMALGVREVLGPGVPVTGFDNDPGAARVGLTSVDPDLGPQVRWAIRVLGALGGEPIGALAGFPDTWGHPVYRTSCGCEVSPDDQPPTAPPPAPPPPGAFTERVGPLFEAILDSRDMAELTSCLNRALPAEAIDFWRILPPQDRNAPQGASIPLRPEGPHRERFDLVVHSLFREKDLYGYFLSDLSNGDYVLSEWLRLNLCLTFQNWQRLSGRTQVQRLLQGELERFTRRQKEVETVVDSLPVWIAELDRRLQPRYFNRRMNVLAGLEPGERRHQSFLTYVAPMDREKVRNRLDACWKSKEPSGIDFRLTDRNGGLVSVVGQIQALDPADGSHLSALFGSLHGGGGVRLVGLELNPLLDGVVQPEALLLKHYAFSPREQELIGLLARGLDVAEVAALNHVSKSTIRVQLHRIYRKTGVNKMGEFLDLLGEYHAKTARPHSLTQLLLSRLFTPGRENRSE